MWAQRARSLAHLSIPRRVVALIVLGVLSYSLVPASPSMSECLAL